MELSHSPFIMKLIPTLKNELVSLGSFDVLLAFVFILQHFIVCEKMTLGRISIVVFCCRTDKIVVNLGAERDLLIMFFCLMAQGY